MGEASSDKGTPEYPSDARQPPKPGVGGDRLKYHVHMKNVRESTKCRLGSIYMHRETSGEEAWTSQQHSPLGGIMRARDGLVVLPTSHSCGYRASDYRFVFPHIGSLPNPGWSTSRTLEKLSSGGGLTVWPNLDSQ